MTTIVINLPQNTEFKNFYLKCKNVCSFIIRKVQTHAIKTLKKSSCSHFHVVDLELKKSFINVCVHVYTHYFVCNIFTSRTKCSTLHKKIKIMQLDQQSLALFLISTEAKDVPIHIHAALNTRRHNTFTAYIYHITLNVIRLANTI